jgi:hypothetical protein
VAEEVVAQPEGELEPLQEGQVLVRQARPQPGLGVLVALRLGSRMSSLTP